MLNRNGQTLVGVLVVLVVFMIFIPSLVFLIQHESKWTVKHKKSTYAFQAAESGTDRAIWKLKETAGYWDAIIAGGSIPDYTGTTVFDVYSSTNTDAHTGQYKVSISSNSAGQVLIKSKGRDTSTSEIRTIEIVLTKKTISSGLDVDGEIEWKPNLIVHWGPVITYDSITKNPMDWFPRKFSKGQIIGRDTNPSPPNTDDAEYWAFEHLPQAPRIDLEHYRQLARNSTIPLNVGGNNEIRRATGNQLAVASPAGSGYFPIAVNGAKIRFFSSYTYTNSTSVIFCEGGMDFANNTFLDVKAALAEGNVDFNAEGEVFTATVPVNAGLEYVKSKMVDGTYTYPGEGSATYDITQCGMHGFLFAGGNFSNAGGWSAICGVVKIEGNITMNTFRIYYDPEVAKDIQLLDATIEQVSWREVAEKW